MAQMVVNNFLKKTLGESNFESSFVFTGEEALKKFDELNPNFVCVDVVMEGMDGLELAKNIAKKKDHAKIIIISSQDYDETSLKKEIPVIKSIIKKPVTLEKFKTALEEANIK